MKHIATFAAALLAAAGAQAACYTVLGAKGQVLSESPAPPVDMSYQLHQTVPYKYGQGATMIFGLADSNCGHPTDPFYNIEGKPIVYDGPAANTRGRGVRRSPRRDRE